jgi:CHAT domain-containing protein
VQLVDLGDAREVDAAAIGFRKAIADGTPGMAWSSRLRQLVWEPLAAGLKPQVETVYLCPDSVLTAVPWGALPGEDGQSPLLEEYAFAVVPSGHVLLEQLQTPPTEATGADSLLMVGDVAFGERPEEPEDVGLLVTRSVVGRRGGLSFPPLPATRVEVENIGRIMDSRPATTLCGVEASVQHVTRQLPKARWAHFATHGFFTRPKPGAATQSDGLREFELPGYDFGAERVTAAKRNPLLLSGLVLAGANLPPESDEFGVTRGPQGILTAEAISYLPLDGLQLAVLSACETGLGDVADGEGVLGLQRAFHTAGTKNVIASLWQVDDEATAALMTLFYHKLLTEEKTPLQALRESQLALSRSPELVARIARDRGIDFSKTAPIKPSPDATPGKTKRGNPRNWAAFVLSGLGR